MFFCEGDEDEIDNMEYNSDGDDKIDSTEDEGNDDETTGTGGKIIYIYIEMLQQQMHMY